MDYTNLAIGIFALGFGSVTFILRVSGKTEKLGKLEKMKEYWGSKKGNIIHLIAYTIVPIVAGVLLLVSAFYAR